MSILNVLPFQETLNASMCGPASLKIVLEYWGCSKTEQELAMLCDTDVESGTNDESLKRAAEVCGFKVEIKNDSSFGDIRSWLDKKVPLIVDWLSRGRNDYPDSAVAEGHFSVIVGLDEQFIYLQDPEIGRIRKIKRDDFLTVWFDYTGKQINSWDDLIIRQIIAIYPPNHIDR